MNNIFIIKNEEVDIHKDLNLIHSNVFNLSQIEIVIQCQPEYKIHLYTMNSLEYIVIDDLNSFYNNLKKYCTENLNYILNEFIDDEKKLIEVYITPIITSA